MEKAEELLNLAIEKFYVDKLELDNFKKSTEKYNKEIKDLMQKLNTTEHVTDNGLVAKMSVQKRESFNEDLLLSKIRSLEVPGIIKSKEYVDMDALENAIYNGELDATELASCRVTKEVITLKVNERKDK